MKMHIKKKHKTPFQVKILFPVLRTIIDAFISAVVSVRMDGADVINKQKSGCVLLANHQSNIDPFIINILLNRQVRYLMSDSNLRTTLNKIIFWCVGVISKKKSMRDMNSVKRAINTVRGGGIVGIFPEGVCSWDGNTASIITATAKLIMLLRAPVYSARVHGSYFVLPRWGHGLRRGSVSVEFRLLYSSAQLAQCSVDEVRRACQESIQGSAHAIQQAHPQYYKSKHRAEWCERMLFICPLCKQFSSIVSAANTISCTKCGELAYLNHQYCLESVGKRIPFTHFAEWNIWQREYWYAYLDRHAAAPAKNVLLEPEQVIVKTGCGQDPLVNAGIFSISLLDTKVLHYQSQTGESTHVNIADIMGCNVQNGEILEYYLNNVLYQVTITHKRRNAYKWMLAIHYFRGCPR